MSDRKDKETDKINKKDNKKDNEKVKEKNNRKQVDYKKKPPPCLTQKRLQICAWVLLTVGLCIVVTTFYVAIQQNNNYNDVTVAVAEGKVLESSAEMTAVQSVPSGMGPSTHRTGRNKFSDYLLEIIGKNVNTCQEKGCQISCKNVGNVYVALHDTLQNTSCPSIDVLVLESQDFPLGILKNYWLPSNISFYEVIIRFSNITKIKCNAFNTPLFKDTFVLSLSHMTIDKVESGALLGLYRLKYLTIKSHILKYEPSIFQPVQTTLVNLKLNANLTINGNKNLFGVSSMKSLTYLDLSSNVFKGSLGKKFFKSTPNLKYLIIVESHIEHIEEDAFEILLGKLLFVNLSKNLITTLSPSVLQPILVTQPVAMLNLANNDWTCNCQLLEFAKLYKKYRLQFMDILYCKGPHHLYGMSLDEIDFAAENCNIVSTTVQETIEEKEYENETTSEGSVITTTTSKAYNGEQSVENSSDYIISSEVSSTERSNTLKMRCFDISFFAQSSDLLKSQDRQSPDILENSMESINNDLDYLQFPAPAYDFQLHLIPENNSVIVSIDNPADVLVIWFSDQVESSVISYGETSFDYECMQYALPELMIGPLQSNTTYTFCLLPPLRNDISPFNCLPLYVPPQRKENVWISKENKEFTIGMLCLIFLLSTIAGALIAYFGIKTYPDLLEGSKNVLVVKKPDQACYVATISEVEYQKQASMKKKKKVSTAETPLKKQPSIKLPLPDTPNKESPPLPYCMSVNDLERLNSLKSSSTCFEDTFPSYNFVDDEYETPKICNDEHTIEQRSVPNAYGLSPHSPPPLPKRNSNVSNSPTLIINRFSSNFN
ncbi:uncharacterized protein ACRADG_011148 [Cochliomyia hominivorax]